MKLTAAQTDRSIGVLVGAACGDALGAGYEFGSARLDGPPGMIGGGLGGFAPGEWTDDTAQTWAIAETAATGVDLAGEPALDAIASRFADWYADGPPDVGVMTAQVLRSAGRHPSAATMRAAARDVHARTGHTAGNGTLMRTAAVALAHLDDPAALVRSAVAVATLTHHDPLGGEACALWCLGIAETVVTGRLPDLVALTDHLPADRRGFWVDVIEDAERRPPASFDRNGYVVTALQAAWSAITHTPVPADDPGRGVHACRHLVDALGAAVAIGHDTDTVATIAGAMLGARWGVSAIPWSWRRIVHGWPGRTAKDLADLAVLTVRGGVPDSAGWPTGDRIDYDAFAGRDALVAHPYDAGVLLSGVDALDDLPAEVTAVVSLARLGRRQVPHRVVHAEFRLIDTTEADNPNLAFVIDDAARTVRTLRAEGHTVLLHCVAAQSRTPTVAARYGALLGRPTQQALAAVVSALPAARPGTGLATAARSLDAGHDGRQ